MFGMLFGRLWGMLAAMGAVLVAAFGIYLRGRSDAKRAAEIAARRAEDERRKKADEAARDYRSDDLVDRLRRGGF